MLPNSHETELALDNTGSLNSASTLAVEDQANPGHSARLKSEIRVWRKGEILDFYRILDTLGEGSSSVVYRVINARKFLARHTRALKYLRRRNDRAKARFVGEVKALNDLAGLDGIPDLYESQLDREDPYFVMESIEGQTLSHLKGSRDSWSEQSALSLVAELGRIVSRLHERGYIHRDLKPSNVIVRDRDSALYLIDFGLARGPDGDSFKTRGPLGTPYYMSPEQTRLLNRDLSPASDVWGLGVILYELVVGRRPFLAKNPFHLMQKIARDRPRKPITARPNLDPTLNDLILRMLSKDPDKRPKNAMSVVAEAETLLDSMAATKSEETWLSRSWRKSLKKVLNRPGSSHQGQDLLVTTGSASSF